MRSMILAFAILPFFGAHADLGRAFGTVKGNNCYLQASNMKDFTQALSTSSPIEYFSGVLVGTLVGELDPYALGEGGLLALELNDGSKLVFWEPDHEAPGTKAIAQNAKQGLKLLALHKSSSCIRGRKLSTRKVREMRSLAEGAMGLKGPFKFFKLK